MTLAVVRGLTVAPAGGPAVVRGVDLTVAPGEVVGVVGRSGSGKTTLALTLLGHVRPGLRVREGTVRVGGADPLTREGARRVRGASVSFLGQDPASALNPVRRVGAQVAEAVRLRGPAAATRAQVGADVARLLSGVGLPVDRAFLRRYPHSLSGGQAQRVALAIALAGSPDLMVLDEPTSGLDSVLAQRTRVLVTEVLRDHGRAALLVSHDLHLVAGLADRVMVMEAGRVVREGAPRDVLAERLAPVRVTPRPPGTESPPGGLLVHGVSAFHGSTRVLVDVSLRVPTGSCTAVVGPSGSGKTTLARCAAGLHRMASGGVDWDASGSPGPASARTRPRRGHIQFVQQDPVGALNPRETVRGALLRPLRALRGLDEARAEREVDRLLDLVRLPPDVAGRRPAGLSGGERQRVALARALAADPVVLICDEVTSALDPEIARSVLDLLDSLRRELGLTLLLVTHDLAVVARHADHVTVLDRGRVVESGPVGEVLTRPREAVTRHLLACAPSLARAESATVPGVPGRNRGPTPV
ncbi:ABC transporter ATP-binding protein [Yinghuangia sp. YIM S09857]|uniref:ABC transporter ATP-binding protein n=1 Tax=Yinghuangia sp. YIM S09857 TaxID=3436929 RepID=UPI003F53E393